MIINIKGVCDGLILINWYNDKYNDIYKVYFLKVY